MMMKKNRFSLLFIHCGLILISSQHAAASSNLYTPVNIAFLHSENSDHKTLHHSHPNNHNKGCFITTTPQNHARGIRHWVNPCPHKKLKHMNPYHPPHHKLDH